jgi:hypothetical protein
MSFFSGANASGFGAGTDPTAALFDAAVPVSTPPGRSGYAPAAASAAAADPLASENTLDEPIWETVKRDARRIGANLRLVLLPAGDRSQQSAALRNWDLWGPMAFTLGLAALLSAGSPKPSATFSLVFALVSVGACVLTVNAVLLGGTIGFFQSLCLIGYALFPLDAAALACLLAPMPLVRWIVVPLGVAWASWASVPFVAGAVPPGRRALAVYPLGLLYLTIGWLALVR